MRYKTQYYVGEWSRFLTISWADGNRTCSNAKILSLWSLDWSSVTFGRQRQRCAHIWLQSCTLRCDLEGKFEAKTTIETVKTFWLFQLWFLPKNWGTKPSITWANGLDSWPFRERMGIGPVPTQKFWVSDLWIGAQWHLVGRGKDVHISGSNPARYGAI